jgi:hypothetical protein
VMMMALEIYDLDSREHARLETCQQIYMLEAMKRICEDTKEDAILRTTVSLKKPEVLH